MEIKKEEIQKYLEDGYVISQETKYVAFKSSSNGDLSIGEYDPKKGIFAGVCEGKELYVSLKDLSEKYNFEDAQSKCSKGYRVPTQKELMLIYINKDKINESLLENGGEELKEDWYWSSSEDGNSWAWGLNFSDGSANGNNTKNYNYYVRPVLAF